MKVEIEKHGSVAVLVPDDALIEEFVIELRAAAEQLMQSAGSVRAVIDMSNVPFVDSAGIECLLELAGGSNGSPHPPRIASLCDTVREALQLTESLSEFAVFESVESAVRSYL